MTKLLILALIVIAVSAFILLKLNSNIKPQPTAQPQQALPQTVSSPNCQVTLTQPTSTKNQWIFFERPIPSTYPTVFTHQVGLVVGEDANAIDSYTPATVYISCAKNDSGYTTAQLLEKLTFLGANSVSSTTLWGVPIEQISDPNMANSNQTTSYIFATDKYIYEINLLGDIGDDQLSKEVKQIFDTLKF